MSSPVDAGDSAVPDALPDRILSPSAGLVAAVEGNGVM